MSSMLLLRLTYPQTVLFPLQDGSRKEALEYFWYNMHLLQAICLVQSETVVY